MISGLSATHSFSLFDDNQRSVRKQKV